MSKSYPHLRKAGLSMDYLHTNSTTHAFIFGAIAEIVDNSRDANATALHIYAENRRELRGGYMLCFRDDGNGMSPYECADIMVLGASNKKSSSNTEFVGQYGNGLKSSTLRIANDFIVFTKKDGILSIAFLSRTFYSDEGIHKNDVLIAVPSFMAQSKNPWFDSNEDDEEIAKARHQSEINLILKYSPFKSEAELFQQFDKIEGYSGTLVVIFNMLLNNNGNAYLQIDEEKKDIILRNDNEEGLEIDELGFLPEERKSFRRYVSILYSNPRMKIYIQGTKVRTKIFEQTLFQVKQYKYITKAFMSKVQQDIKEAERELGSIKRRLEEAKSDVSDFKIRNDTTSKLENRQLLKKNKKVSVFFEEYEKKKKELEDLKISSKVEKHITFKFGLNLQNRSQSGGFIYNQHRLIMMYKKMGKQLKNDPDYHGIVILVDVPYSIMNPQHNKQSFEKQEEYHKLKTAIAEHLDQYVRDIKYELRVDRVSDFWKEYGYLHDDCDVPDNSQSYALKRFRRLPIIVQCNACLKWREVQANSAYLDQLDRCFPDSWSCANLNKLCTEPESLPVPAKGELKKEEKRPKPAEPESIRYTNPTRPSIEVNDSPVMQAPRLNPLEIAKQNSAQLAEKKAGKVPGPATSRIKSMLRSDPSESLSSSTSSSSISSPTANSGKRDNAIINRVLEEVEREDRERRTTKRPSEDGSSLYDDDASDDNNGIMQQRLNLINSKKARRGPNMADLDTQSEPEDPDYNPRAPNNNISKKNVLNKVKSNNNSNNNHQSNRFEKNSTTVQLPIKGEPLEMDDDLQLRLWNKPELKKYQLHLYQNFRIADLADYKAAADQYSEQIKRLLNEFSDSRDFNVCSDEFLLSFDFGQYIIDKAKTLDAKVKEEVKKTIAHLRSKSDFKL